MVLTELKTGNVAEVNVPSQHNGLLTIFSPSPALIAERLIGGRLAAIDLTTANLTLRIMLSLAV